MDLERFEHHLSSPSGRDRQPAGAHAGSAGGSVCGDLVVVRVSLDADGTVRDAGFSADGCGALTAAGSAAVELVTGMGLVDAARIGPAEIIEELGGLSVGKRHAADLVADALAVALGAAAVADVRMAPYEDRTLVAMSGGVDSAVAALLCRGAGRDVLAVTLELWRDEENDAEGSCCSASAVRGARALAHRLGIAHLTVDLREAFRTGVVEPWVRDHAAGLTPNPCVHCNGEVRLDAMVELADRLGARDLATGHYARVGSGGLLRAAVDPDKDQTYMLAALAPASVARMRFPLGELTKPQVREIAADAGLAVADKPDSQDLCFLAGTARRRFLERHGGLQDRPGDLVDPGGNVVGRHGGAQHFTVGQRRGIGIGAPEPLYVLGTDIDRNVVTVGPRRLLDTTGVQLRDVALHRPAAEVDRVRLRYRSAPIGCLVEHDAASGSAIARLAEPVQGVSPGQVACLLSGELIVGWATIMGSADASLAPVPVVEAAVPA